MSDMVPDRSRLDILRDQFAQIVIVFIWVNVLLVIATAWWVGNVSFLAMCGAALLLGAASTLVWLKYGAAVETRLATAMSLAALVALFVAALYSPASENSFQIDGHMYFFAVLAVLVGWVDWRAIVAYSAVVAVHHLVLNFTIPCGRCFRAALIFLASFSMR